MLFLLLFGHSFEFMLKQLLPLSAASDCQGCVANEFVPLIHVNKIIFIVEELRLSESTAALSISTYSSQCLRLVSQAVDFPAHVQSDSVGAFVVKASH